MEDRTEMEIQISELEDKIFDQERELSALEDRILDLESRFCHTCKCVSTKENKLTYTADPKDLGRYGDDAENWYCVECLLDSHMET